MAVGIHGSFVVKAEVEGETPRPLPEFRTPLVAPTACSPAGVEEATGKLAPAIMKPMGPAEIYTILLAALLVGGALWVLSRFAHRD